MRKETKVTRIAVGPDRIDTLAIDPRLDDRERSVLIDSVGPLASEHVVHAGDVTHVQPDIDPSAEATTAAVRHDVVHALMTTVRQGAIIPTPGNFRERPL